MADLYVDGIYDKRVWDAVQQTMDDTHVASGSEWRSRPRPASSPVAEVLRYRFARPSSISHLSFSARRTGWDMAAWYVDRQGRRRPLLRDGLQSVAVTAQAVEGGPWGDYEVPVYPAVATSVDLMFTRRDDPAAPAGDSPVYVRDVLFRRAVLTRQDAALPTPTITDSLGNTVAHMVHDWPASAAVDGDDTTFWRSGPQPVPDAVVCLYVDCRDGQGRAQWVDRFWLDPVSAGQDMNVYVSNDETAGVRRLSENAISPDSQENTTWQPGLGMLFNDEAAAWRVRSADIGFDASHSWWAGLVWAPTGTPAQVGRAVLFQAGPDIELVFDTDRVTLTVSGAQASAQIPAWQPGDTLTIAVGANMPADSDTPGPWVAVRTTDGAVHEDDQTALPIAPSSVTVTGADSLEALANSMGAYLAPSGQQTIIEWAYTAVPDGATARLSTQTDDYYGGWDTPGRYDRPATLDTGAAQVMPARTSRELSPNRALSYTAAHIGQMQPDGRATINYGAPQFFSQAGYITARPGDVFTCEWEEKTVIGSGQLSPVISTAEAAPAADRQAYTISRTSTLEVRQDGTRRLSCTVTALTDWQAGRLGFEIVPTASDTGSEQTYLHYASLTPSDLQAAGDTARAARYWETVEAPVQAGDTTVRLTIEPAPGVFRFRPPVVSGPAPSLAPSVPDTVGVGNARGHVAYFVVKQAPRDESMNSWLQAPGVYATPDAQNRASLNGMILAARWELEEAVRGGTDESEFLDKVWSPIYSDWQAARRWYYLPRPMNIKFLKLEFTNLVMEPYPVWEDGLQAEYQVFPVEVVETSRKVASITETATTTTTVTSQDTTDETTWTQGKFRYTKGRDSFHSESVEQDRSSSSSYSETTLPREYEVTIGKPASTRVPPRSGITMSTEFAQEKASTVLYKGSTSDVREAQYISTFDRTHESARVYQDYEREYTYFEKQVVATTKMVWQDVYYRVVRGDTLIGISHKTGIPDWKIILAYNMWLQSDRRIRLLPRRYAGWWIFPGQNFRIPQAVLRQVTTYETVWVPRTSTRTVRESWIGTLTSRVNRTVDEQITTTTDTEVMRHDTTDITRQRFRSESVHRYDHKTVERVQSVAYFAAVRELKIAKVNWQRARDYPVFDFVDFEGDGWQLEGVYRNDYGVWRPAGPEVVGQMTSPVYETISAFRAIRMVGVNRNAISQYSDIAFRQAVPWTPAAAGFDPGRPSPTQAMWADTAAVWADRAAPWGATYSASFQQSAVEVTKDGLIVTGGTGAGTTAVALPAISGRQQERVSFTVELTPRAPVSVGAAIILALIGPDGRVLSQREFPETDLSEGAPSVLQSASAFLPEDTDGILPVIIFRDKGPVDYLVSAASKTVGTMRVMARNTEGGAWEDISDLAADPSNAYAFGEWGRNLQVQVRMTDPGDWVHEIQIIPVYRSDDIV